MNTGAIIGLFTIFTIVWGGGLWVVDTRNEARTIATRDSLRIDIKKEVGRYQNVYTLEEIVDVVNSKYLEGFGEVKVFLNSESGKSQRMFEKYVLDEKNKFETFILEDYDGNLTLMQVIERKDTVPLIRPYLKIN